MSGPQVTSSVRRAILADANCSSLPHTPHEVFMQPQPAPARPLNTDQDILVALGQDHTGIWRRNWGANHLTMNAQAFAMLGLPAQAGALPAAVWRRRVHPQDLAALLVTAQRCLQSARPLAVQARYRHEDGSWRVLLSHHAVLRGADGQPKAWVGTVIDVTPQLDVALTSPNNTRRFELVTRTAGIGYWTYSQGDMVPVWSNSLRELYGLQTHDQVPTATQWIEEFVHADDRKEVAQCLNEWMAGQVPNMTVAHRIVRRDGRLRHLLSHARRDSSAAAEGRYSYGVAIDLTEQRQAEIHWQRMATRAALAARAIGMGAWEVDLETGQATWDEQMFALRRLSPRSEPLLAAERLALVHPDDRARVQAINARAHTVSDPVEMEFRVVWPDGSVRWLASRSLELAADADGKRRRIGVNWDITEKHEAQQALQAREIALHESQARELAKSQFLSRMSHELRTPLNAVLGFTQLLLAEPEVNGSPTRQQRLMHIETAGRHLLGLVNDALDLSHVQSADSAVAVAGTAPRRSASPPGEAAPHTEAAATATPHRLLYIEDNPVNAMIVKELLARRSDLQLHIAVDGASGVQRALQIRPDLILIDMQLPDMDGLQVLRLLRAEPTLGQVTCIALSANALTEDIQRALKAGMADYWTKPLDFAAFLKALDNLLGKSSTLPAGR